MYWKSTVDNSVTACDEIINQTNTLSTNATNTTPTNVTSTVSINSVYKKVACGKTVVLFTLFH